MSRAGIRLAICAECNGLIGWIECPTGGWWGHEVHPADNHDAVVSGVAANDDGTPIGPDSTPQPQGAEP